MTILRDASNAPSEPSDAISIEIGFTARLVGSPTTVAPDPPLPPTRPAADTLLA